MVTRRYSGYLADDESLRGPQMRNLNACQRRGTYDWGNMMRPPSRCQFRNPDSMASTSTSVPFPCKKQGKRKHRESSNAGESSHLAAEFSEFVDFLADEDVLDSLQSIMEDAVQKLRNVTTEEGEPVFEIPEESCSSRGSESWSISYSSVCSQSSYYTTSLSSDDEWQRWTKSKALSKPEGQMCLLDKYKARLPKLEKTTRQGVSGGFHAETFSEQSSPNYFFQREHFHIWAKLAESFEQLQPPKKNYFAKFQKQLPEQSFSFESLHKEITNVLKRPTPSSIPLYYPGNQPFQALDFLEENKILASLQDIINQAVCQVLEATGMEFFDEEGHRIPWDSSIGYSDEEEEEEERGEGEGEREGEGEGEGEEEGSGSVSSGSEEGISDEDSKSEGSKTKKKKKKKKKGKGKKKKRGKLESPSAEEKGKTRYTPPPLPKSRRKSLVPEELQRKPKYVPPPLPKTKPRLPPEEPTGKPRYTPPPLPKSRQKMQDSLASSDSSRQAIHARHIITAKDIKRARIHGRPLPKQSIIDFLIENAAKLILYKYNYETLLSEKLGFISVPVTKVLLEIMFGYKNIKGSGIRLSSQIDWAKVSKEVNAVRPRKPKSPKPKAKDKKKAEAQKKKKAKAKLKKSQRSVFFTSEMPHGKVIVMKTAVKHSKPREKVSTTEPEDDQVPEIFEIVPPQFSREPETEEISPDEEDESLLVPSSTRKSDVDRTDSPEKPATSEETLAKVSSPTQQSQEQSPILSPKQSQSSRRTSQVPGSTRESTTYLPEVETTSQLAEEPSKKASSSCKSSLDGEGSKTVLPKISN